MNYRHAYHAGNFADVFKHAVLVQLMLRLRGKETPFSILDTHAGQGLYDLSSPEAMRTGEHLRGIGRLTRSSVTADYLDIVAGFDGAGPSRLYPGSPCIARALLRPQDRLNLAELHPQEAASLRRQFARDRQVAVHEMDGYGALKAFLPPKERRGLVLIDPPYEAAEEFATAAKALATGWRRWPTGIFALWYPIKQRPAVWAFHEAVASSGIGKALAAEFLVHPEDDWNRLNGCGMLFVNPPWLFEEWLHELLPALLADLAEPGAAGSRIEWLVRE